jgi:cellulose 1,4-beta-cellobiosidase
MSLNHAVRASVVACASAVALAQQPGHQKQSGSLPITYQTCANSNGCSTQQGSVVVDANWCWVHKVGDYHNCYTGDQWDSTLCPDPQTCATNCALDNGSPSEYESIYGPFSRHVLDDWLVMSGHLTRGWSGVRVGIL